MSARLRAWFRSAPVAVNSSEAGAADGDLVSRFADTRDDGAFAELVRRHGPMVLAVCRRALHPDVHTADDAFQATFLVLATRAATVAPPERVGAWLHGVAFHVARKAKAWARRAAPSPPADLDRIAAAPFGPDPDAAETRAQIDAALAGMPSKYRAAVVLCDLEQRSRADAAAALGWTEGALSGRLSRARKLLADRLARRGVAVPAAGLGVLLPAAAATAAVPMPLAASTVRAAALVASGAAAGDAIPAPVAALARGVPVVHPATFKLLAAGVTGVALALGGWGLYTPTAAQPPAPVPPATPAPPAPVARGWVAKHAFAYTSAVTAVAIGPDLVAAGDKDGVLILWDARTGKEKEKLLDGGGDGAKPIDRLQVSTDGTWLYLVTNDRNNYHQCSVEKGDRIFPGSGSNGQAKSYGVTPDGAFWLDARGNRTLGLIANRLGENVLTGATEARFPHKEDIALAAACDADFVGTVSAGVLRRWAKGKNEPVWEEKLDGFEASALAACPRSKVFAVGGKSGEVRVYFGLTGKLSATLKGHTNAVTAIAFAPDGKHIVTGGADTTARVWDAAKGTEVAALKGHTGAVGAVAVGPGGDTIATGSQDKTVRVWVLNK